MVLNFSTQEKLITKNGVGIIVDKDLNEEVVDVKRIDDRIITIKLVLEKEIINIISAYVP